MTDLDEFAADDSVAAASARLESERKGHAATGGIYPSMLKFLHRKHRQFEATGQPWDVALMGHWHQYLTGPDFLLNGSLKSYDEYAASNGFGYEPARQALAIVTPERGIVQQMPVYAD